MKKLILCVMIFLMGAVFVACGSEAETSSNYVPDYITAERIEQVRLVKVTGDVVNIRNSASLDSQIVAVALEGQYLELVEEGEEWNIIKYNGMQLYISADYTVVENFTKEEATQKLEPEESESSSDSSTDNTTSSQNTEDGEA